MHINFRLSMRQSEGAYQLFSVGYKNRHLNEVWPRDIYYLFEAGHERKQEDYIWPISGKATEDDKVFIVCDGEGSYNNGAIASKLVCQYMAVKALKFDERKISGDLINKYLGEARDRLIDYARENRLDTDLASSFAMVVLFQKRILMSWFGNSRIYHVRGGEILFRTEDHALARALNQSGIQADHSSIEAESRWIDDVQDGDYFLICSKGLMENVQDSDIKNILGQEHHEFIDLAQSFKQKAYEKTVDNYSMYLIRIGLENQTGALQNGDVESGKSRSRFGKPVYMLSMTIIGFFILLFYFRSARTSNAIPKNVQQAAQPAGNQRSDSIPDAMLIWDTPKTTPTTTDSAKKTAAQIQTAPQKDDTGFIQTRDISQEENKASTTHAKPVKQQRLKLTSDLACKLQIRNITLDQVVDWDLSPNENITIFLKPGKYSITATSTSDSSKTKTYDLEVNPGDEQTIQNLNIQF